jgi:hypothetical protein
MKTPRPPHYETCARRLPWIMMPILEQSASASSMECVVSTTARDCAMREINAHMCRRVSGSIPVEGSSRNVTYTGWPRASALDIHLQVMITINRSIDLMHCRNRRGREGGSEGRSEEERASE